MLVGYARVSTQDQNPNLQLDALKAAGCEKVYVEKASGARSGFGRGLGQIFVVVARHQMFTVNLVRTASRIFAATSATFGRASMTTQRCGWLRAISRKPWRSLSWKARPMRS